VLHKVKVYYLLFERFLFSYGLQSSTFIITLLKKSSEVYTV